MSDATQETLKNHVAAEVFEALQKICGGGLQLEGDKEEGSSVVHDDASWRVELKEVAQKTVSFSNKQSESLGGKPHDVEIRAALTLFHKNVGRKRKRLNNTRPVVSAVSDLGVCRSIDSPFALAELLCCTLEESLRQEDLSHDVRPNASAIICLVTPERAKALRDSGRLPCPKCVKWCKGEKGLWWHQQMEHGSEHSVAAAAAASEQNVLAIVPCDPQQTLSQPVSTIIRTKPIVVAGACSDETDHVFELVRKGNLKALKQAIQNGFGPRESLDRNGASLLLWAAGSGHLDIVTYLIETCHCLPNLGQKGKRSFSGRTPLHWTARNGHLNVVQYLVDKCYVDIDAVTADGTTAFCWASWQGHLSVMKFLHERGADVQKSNSFGCNAVLWCAQGKGTVETMEWLQSIGLDLLSTNTNGHGALHKAAQRKRRDLCEWLCSSALDNDNASDTTVTVLFDNIGPDTEDCCPSDLAGMAGYDELAIYIAEQETRLACRWFIQLMGSHAGALDEVNGEKASRLRGTLPKWLQREDIILTLYKHVSQSELNMWAPGGGVRRIQYYLRMK